MEQRFLRLKYPGSGAVAVFGDADSALPGRVESSFAQLVPTGLDAKVDLDSTGMVVTLIWDAVAGAARYLITRAQAGGAVSTERTDGPGSSWFDRGVTPGIYTYAVAVVAASGRVGAASRPVRVRVEAVPADAGPPPGTPPVAPMTADPWPWTPTTPRPAWGWRPSTTKPGWGYALDDMDSPTSLSYVDVADLPGKTFDLPHAISARSDLVSMLEGLGCGAGPNTGIEVAQAADLTSDRPYLTIGTTSSWLSDALDDRSKLTDLCGLTTDLGRCGWGLAIRIDDPYTA